MDSLEREVQVSVYGCEARLSLCLYLQMRTFEIIGSVLVLGCNWCWHQHGDKSLQTAAHTEFGGSSVHYRYACTLWRSWTDIVFYNYGVWFSFSRFSADHQGPPLDHILSQYNSARIFITWSLIFHCITCHSKIHPIIIIHIFKDLGSDSLFLL